MNTKIDIIALCEVKIKSSFPLNIYNIPGYKMYHSLRSERGGGGVICFIQNSVVVENFIATAKSFEKLSFKLNFDSMKLNFTSYYRAPNNNNMKELLEDVEQEMSRPGINAL
jgi:exonuclease III